MKRLRLIVAALCLLAANVIPVAASEGTDLPKVIDDAGILSDYDEAQLSSQIDELIQQYQIDIVLMTENRRQEGTAQAEADLQYVNRGYGIGEGKDGIMFLLDMGSREWAISTNGAAMTMFSDYDLSALGDHAASGYFSSDQYYQGFQSYLKELNKTLERNLNPQKEENKLGDALASAIADGQKEAESKQEEKACTLKKGTVLASGPLMLKDGQVCDLSGTNRNFVDTKHPRSAVALTREGKILLIVVDGRRKGKAEGINIPELAHMIRILGGEDALNLDGGGSSTLWSGALPDKGIANTPSGSAERKVANSLCVYE